MLLLTRHDVEALLDPDRLIDAVADAMVGLSAGTASSPPRVAAAVDGRDAFLAAMPAYLPGAGALTTKLVSVFPHNHDVGLPSHQALIVAFDPDTGTPTAVMDGTHITAMRTAAGSALSARLLARPDASVLAILGTGVQAGSHGLMLPRVRAFHEGRIAGRDPAKAAALAGRLSVATGVPFAPAASFEEAVDAAHVVCATTHSPEPVVRRAWLAPGAHDVSRTAPERPVPSSGLSDVPHELSGLSDRWQLRERCDRRCAAHARRRESAASRVHPALLLHLAHPATGGPLRARARVRRRVADQDDD